MGKLILFMEARKVRIKRIIYILITSVGILGIFFKLQHWSGGGILLTISMSALSILLFYVAISLRKSWFMVIPLLIGFLILIMLFKIQHWSLWIIGIFEIKMISIVTIVLILIFLVKQGLKFRRESVKLSRYFFITGVLFGFENLMGYILLRFEITSKTFGSFYFILNIVTYISCIVLILILVLKFKDFIKQYPVERKVTKTILIYFLLSTPLFLNSIYTKPEILNSFPDIYQDMEKSHSIIESNINQQFENLDSLEQESKKVTISDVIITETADVFNYLKLVKDKLIKLETGINNPNAENISEGNTHVNQLLIEEEFGRELIVKVNRLDTIFSVLNPEDTLSFSIEHSVEYLFKDASYAEVMLYLNELELNILNAKTRFLNSYFEQRIDNFTRE